MDNYNVLKNALREAAIREMMELPNEIEITINPFIQKRLKEKVNTYIKKNKRKNTIAASITIALLLSISVDAIRKPLFTPIIETLRQYTSVKFEVNEGVEDVLDKDVQYEVTYIPKDYKLKDERENMFSSAKSYENEDGSTVSIKYYKPGYASVLVDTSDAILEKIMIDGEEAIIYEIEEVIYFLYVTSYSEILGQLSNGGENAKEEVIKMVESIKDVKEN